MHYISEKIWGYTKDSPDPQKISAKMISKNTNVHVVKTFPDLVSKVATLSFLNPKMFLLFRGQEEEYYTLKGNVSIFPTIYRNQPGKRKLTKVVRKQRFEKLNEKVTELRKGYPRREKFSKELGRLNIHYELCWAILQHYQITKTPYLDVTASLRVASSFAMMNTDTGFVYVFGVPYPNGSITHVVDEDIKIVRLQAACPPSAQRPHFQEGFLVGSCYVNSDEYKTNQNLSRRLITRFHIPQREKFWKKDTFDPIPNDALLPKGDKDFGWLK